MLWELFIPSVLLLLGAGALYVHELRQASR